MPQWGNQTSIDFPAGQEESGSQEGTLQPHSQSYSQTITPSYTQPNAHIQHPPPQHNFESQAIGPSGPSSGSALLSDPLVHQCLDCSEVFTQAHLLNKHLKKHNPPFQCSSCGYSFRYRKDLTRHLNEKHPNEVPNAQRFYCSVPGCKYSIGRGDGFARKDNLSRHLRTQHGN